MTRGNEGVLGKVKAFFRQEAHKAVSLTIDRFGIPVDEDIHTAVALLLIEAAASDRDIPDGEAATVRQLLQHTFSLSDSGVEETLSKACAARTEPKKATSLIETLNEHFSEDQRQLVLSLVWRIMLVDGDIHKLEKKLSHQLEFRLHLSEDKAMEARIMAETGRL